MNRVQRRKHKWRKVKKIFNRMKLEDFWKDDIQRMFFAKKRVDGRECCSCATCRNPRTSKITKAKDKLTIQERKAIQIEWETLTCLIGYIIF